MNVSEIWSLLKHPRRNWKSFPGIRDDSPNSWPKHPRRNWKPWRDSKDAIPCSARSILEGIETYSVMGENAIHFRSILEGIETSWVQICPLPSFRLWSILEGIESEKHPDECDVQTKNRSILEGIESSRMLQQRGLPSRSILEGIESDFEN